MSPWRRARRRRLAGPGYVCPAVYGEKKGEEAHFDGIGMTSQLLESFINCDGRLESIRAVLAEASEEIRSRDPRSP